uniref:Uncharacterized protein n=2 Tax=Meloidogyne TaxID=189290 RepID=A0A6V7U2Y3_MELEN|nr:unnamed protein product [Meloidogyne enterolobii]
MDKFYFGVVMKKVTDVGAEFGRYELEPGVFEQFLLADSGEGDDERILIFGRESFGEWSHLVAELYVVQQVQPLCSTAMNPSSTAMNLGLLSNIYVEFHITSGLLNQKLFLLFIFVILFFNMKVFF